MCCVLCEAGRNAGSTALAGDGMSVGRGCNCALADCGMNAEVMHPCMAGNKLIYVMQSIITPGAGLL